MAVLLLVVLVSAATLCVSFDITKLEVASVDGSGNNLANGQWGATFTPLARREGLHYDDGYSEPRGGFVSRLPSARDISNKLCATVDGEKFQTTSLKNNPDVLTYWGQWLAHEIVTVRTVNESFDIPVPQPDLPYNPANASGREIPFFRAEYIGGSNLSDPRLQVNSVTTWIDASNVYGSVSGNLQLIRASDGTMLTMVPTLGSGEQCGEYLPFNNDGSDSELIPMFNDAQRVPSTELFAAGDPRANENPVLSALHLLFVREHNRRVALLPNTLTSEQKFQVARKYIIAYNQNIVYNEYLPALRGDDFPDFTGYDPGRNPTIETLFSVAALRFGHSQINTVVQRLDENWECVPAGHATLRDAFFNPHSVLISGVEAIWRGMIVGKNNEVDTHVIDDARNNLFGQHHDVDFIEKLALDLCAINIQRGRDHGMGGYNDARVAYGIPACSSYSCITSNPDLADIFAEVYGPANISNVDAWIAGLAENKATSNSLGQLFDTIIVEQLDRLRHADRFYFENDLFWDEDDVVEIKGTTLADIIMRNSCDGSISDLPPDVFNLHTVPDIVEGMCMLDSSSDLQESDDAARLSYIAG